MNIIHASKVTALTNPIKARDIVIAGTGERYIVQRSRSGDYSLRHVLSRIKLTQNVSGQIGIIRQIEQLSNI